VTKDSGHQAAKLTEAAQDTARRRLAAELRAQEGNVNVAVRASDLRALLAESVPAGEPVAWIDRAELNGTKIRMSAYRVRQVNGREEPYDQVPLYAAPGHGQEEER